MKPVSYYAIITTETAVGLLMLTRRYETAPTTNDSLLWTIFPDTTKPAKSAAETELRTVAGTRESTGQPLPSFTVLTCSSSRGDSRHQINHR